MKYVISHVSYLTVAHFPRCYLKFKLFRRSAAFQRIVITQNSARNRGVTLSPTLLYLIFKDHKPTVGVKNFRVASATIESRLDARCRERFNRRSRDAGAFATRPVG